MSMHGRDTGYMTAVPEVGRRAILPASMRGYRAPIWWHEITILVVFNLLYERLRNLVPMQEHAAMDLGLRVLHLTENWHIDFELGLNQFFAAHGDLARLANAYYSFLHLPVTSAVLLWLFFRRKRIYRSARTVLATTTLIGLGGFWLAPMAPPRLLGTGFIDTLVQFHTFGSWGSPSVAAVTNQFAAMPSLHCAWALWCGVTVFKLAERPVIRALALLYPLMTFIVVIGTANHFAVDGVAGAAVLAMAYAIHRSLFGRGTYEPAPLQPDHS